MGEQSLVDNVVPIRPHRGSTSHNSISNALSPTGTVATWQIGGDGPPNKVPPKQKPRDGEEAQVLVA